MVNSKKKTRQPVWLRLRGYHVVTLKPDFDEHATGLERAIHQGIPAYPDMARPDFYDVALEEGWAYIHVYRDRHAVYLVAHSFSSFNSFSTDGSGEWKTQDIEMPESDKSSLIRRQTRQVDLLAGVLSRTLHNDPSLTYLIPNEPERRAMLPWFLRSLAVRASVLGGEIYTTDTIDGAALWIRPGRTQAIGRMLRAGLLTAPFRLGWAAFRRFVNLSKCVEEAHRRLARGAHWYLMVLGVEPSNRDALQRTLIEPVLSRADSEGLPCYLETFSPANLPFFKRLGFRIEGAGRIQGGPSFWAMVRAPRDTIESRLASDVI